MKNTIKKGKFLKMIGDVWLQGKAVFAYTTTDPEKIMFIKETTGGKRLKVALIDKAEYESDFEFYGCNGARIAKRAFDYVEMGFAV